MDTGNFGVDDVMQIGVFAKRLSGMAPGYNRDVCTLTGLGADGKTPWTRKIVKHRSSFTLLENDKPRAKVSNLCNVLRRELFPVAIPIFPRPSEWGNKYSNPTQEQLQQLDKIVEQYPLAGVRPDRNKYENELDRLGKAPGIKTWARATVICSNVSKGGDSMATADVVPNKNFDASKNIKPGYSLASNYSSGGSFKIVNAAMEAWKEAWNHGYAMPSREDTELLVGKTQQIAVVTGNTKSRG